ncbi:MAG: hypothetical protein ACJ72E_09630 [Marmoricola sp.]
MTVSTQTAERQDFRETLAATPPPDRTSAVADARRATLANAQTLLRPVEAALGVLRNYGGRVPEPLREARERLRDARIIATGSRLPDSLALAREVISSSDPRKALSAAGKKRAAAIDEAEIARFLYAAAAENAARVFYETASEIADAILASENLAASFEEVRRMAPTVRPADPAEPNRDDLDLVARVAVLRRAVVPFDRVLVSLTSSSLIGNPMLPGAGALIYADPSGADPEAVRRAIKGVRPGVPDVGVWTATATHAAHMAPLAPNGVPAAILAGTPGVEFAQAITVEEFERRIAYVQRAGSVATFVEDEPASSGLVL